MKIGWSQSPLRRDMFLWVIGWAAAQLATWKNSIQWPIIMPLNLEAWLALCRPFALIIGGLLHMAYWINMGKQGFRLGLFAPLALGQGAKYKNLFKSYSIYVCLTVRYLASLSNYIKVNIGIVRILKGTNFANQTLHTLHGVTRFI